MSTGRTLCFYARHMALHIGLTVPWGLCTYWILDNAPPITVAGPWLIVSLIVSLWMRYGSHQAETNQRLRAIRGYHNLSLRAHSVEGAHLFFMTTILFYGAYHDDNAIKALLAFLGIICYIENVYRFTEKLAFREKLEQQEYPTACLRTDPTAIRRFVSQGWMLFSLPPDCWKIQCPWERYDCPRNEWAASHCCELCGRDRHRVENDEERFYVPSCCVDCRHIIGCDTCIATLELCVCICPYCRMHQVSTNTLKTGSDGE